jgi:hypothetical protein
MKRKDLSILTQVIGSRFPSEKLIVDKNFLNDIRSICNYAHRNNVKLNIQKTFQAAIQCFALPPQGGRLRPLEGVRRKPATSLA